MGRPVDDAARSMTVSTLARYECEPGDRETVLALLEPARAATIQEEGCLYFHLLLPREAPDHIFLIEGWRSAEDLAAHRTAPHFTEIILGTIARRVRNRSVEICEELASPAPAGSGSSSHHQLRSTAL
ncbi:antibiotic biosynthesis monooxygenase [Pseudoclavibacter sp. JAI123]|uniref:putative quinol monooxygenase n=1 Tax=Pseudoclavibacter sp. JAI123 TaxID=2723065 RepID=UPI0035B5C6B0